VSKVPWIVVLSLLVGFPAGAQQKSALEQDKAGIERAALDYIAGWYEGNVERMERALHPDLVKRSLFALPTGREVTDSLTKKSMVEMTRAGGGSRKPKEVRKYEVVILDVYGTIASAKTISGEFVDYLHLVKTEGEWKIINVLWVPVKPPPRQ
jgi:hypothetical protein